MSENQEMKDSSESSDESLPTPTPTPTTSIPMSESETATATETTESFEFFPSYSKNRKYQKLYKMLALVCVFLSFFCLILHNIPIFPVMFGYFTPIYPFPYLYVIFSLVGTRYLFMTTPKEKSYLILVVYFSMMTLFSFYFFKNRPNRSNRSFRSFYQFHYFLPLFYNQIALFYSLFMLLLEWNVQHPNQNHLYSYLIFTLTCIIIFLLFSIQNRNQYLASLPSYFFKEKMGVVGNLDNKSSSFVSLKNLKI